MKRRHLFEFHDLEWYPEILRSITVESLDTANRVSGFVDALARAFEQVIAETHAARVLDLCSGAGGPVVQMLDVLERRGQCVPRLTLSDLFVRREAWRRLKERHPQWLDYREDPLDATQIPVDIECDLVTIVNALHHFPPSMVEAILASVVERGASIFIAEGFPRSLFRASAYLPFLLHGVLKSTLLDRRQWRARIARTLILPAVSTLGLWDWAVSALRIHQPAELISLGRRIAPHYQWRSGAVDFPLWGQAVYVTGVAPSNDIDSAL